MGGAHHAMATGTGHARGDDFGFHAKGLPHTGRERRGVVRVPKAAEDDPGLGKCTGRRPQQRGDEGQSHAYSPRGIAYSN